MKNSLVCPLVSAVLLGACGGSAPVAEEPVEAIDETQELELEIETEFEVETEPDLAVVSELDPEAIVLPGPEPAVPTVLDAFDGLLSDYVTDDGGFRYEALLASPQDSARLAAFLLDVSNADLESMERDARLAFLINAYNAYTISSVMELWPVEGVLEEDGFFDGREHTVGGTPMTLNTLENEHIRAAFGEPRIHFVVNCASTGCPWLSPEAITADNLEAMLDRQSRAFVQRTTVLDGSDLEVSQIFEWFEGDFEVSGGVRQFLVEHLEGDLSEAAADDDTDIEYFEYDWSVNAR